MCGNLSITVYCYYQNSNLKHTGVQCNCVTNKPKIDAKREKSMVVLNMKYDHYTCLLICKTVIEVYDDICIWLNT